MDELCQRIYATIYFMRTELPDAAGLTYEGPSFALTWSSDEAAEIRESSGLGRADATGPGDAEPRSTNGVPLYG